MSKNPHAKTQYLDKQKAEMNNLKKENLKLQEDNKVAKRAEEKAKKKLEDLVSTYLQPFGNNLCKVLEIPAVQFDQKAINLPVAKGSKT